MQPHDRLLELLQLLHHVVLVELLRVDIVEGELLEDLRHPLKAAVELRAPLLDAQLGVGLDGLHDQGLHRVVGVARPLAAVLVVVELVEQ